MPWKRIKTKRERERERERGGGGGGYEEGLLLVGLLFSSLLLNLSYDRSTQARRDEGPRKANFITEGENIKSKSREKITATNCLSSSQQVNEEDPQKAPDPARSLVGPTTRTKRRTGCFIVKATEDPYHPPPFIYQ